MPRLRQVSPLFIFALISLLYCSQTCVAAGHAHAAVSATRPDAHAADATPCHPPSTTPRNTDESCTDCGGHFFLTTASSGADVLSATATASAPCVFVSPPATLAASPLAYRSTITQHTSSTHGICHCLFFDSNLLPPRRPECGVTRCCQRQPTLLSSVVFRILHWSWDT